MPIKDEVQKNLYFITQSVDQFLGEGSMLWIVEVWNDSKEFSHWKIVEVVVGMEIEKVLQNIVAKIEVAEDNLLLTYIKDGEIHAGTLEHLPRILEAKWDIKLEFAPD